MDKKQLTAIVDREVSRIGFIRIRKGWRYDLPCADPITIVVGMVKARWSNEFQFWTQVLVVGVFGQNNTNIESFPKGGGTVFRVEQTDYRPLFDLDDSNLSDDERERGIERFVYDSLAPFVGIACSPHGVQRLGIAGLVMVTPPIVAELKRLGLWSEYLSQ